MGLFSRQRVGVTPHPSKSTAQPEPVGRCNSVQQLNLQGKPDSGGSIDGPGLAALGFMAPATGSAAATEFGVHRGTQVAAQQGGKTLGGILGRMLGGVALSGTGVGVFAGSALTGASLAELIDWMTSPDADASVFDGVSQSQIELEGRGLRMEQEGDALVARPFQSTEARAPDAFALPSAVDSLMIQASTSAEGGTPGLAVGHEDEVFRIKGRVRNLRQLLRHRRAHLRPEVYDWFRVELGGISETAPRAKPNFYPHFHQQLDLMRSRILSIGEVPQWAPPDQQVSLQALGAQHGDAHPFAGSMSTDGRALIYNTWQDHDIDEELLYSGPNVQRDGIDGLFPRHGTHMEVAQVLQGGTEQNRSFTGFPQDDGSIGLRWSSTSGMTDSVYGAPHPRTEDGWVLRHDQRQVVIDRLQQLTGRRFYDMDLE